MKVFLYSTMLTLCLSACVGNTTIHNYRPDQEWMLCNRVVDENGEYYTSDPHNGVTMGPRYWERTLLPLIEEAKRRNLDCSRGPARMIPRIAPNGVRSVDTQPAPTQANPQSDLSARTSSATRIERICRRRADQARRVASNNHRPSNTSTSATCREDFFGNYNCSISTGISGGMWGGILAGMSAADAGRDAYELEYETCMIQLGN